MFPTPFLNPLAVANVPIALIKLFFPSFNPTSTPKYFRIDSEPLISAVVKQIMATIYRNVLTS